MQHRKIASITTLLLEADKAPKKPVKQAPHPADQHFGRQIAAVRVRSDFSQPQLAGRVGISFQQLQKYESGRNRVSASMLHKIGSVLGVPACRFFDGLPGNVTADGEVPQLPADERIVFIASAEGRRLMEGLMRLHPRVRARISSLVAALVEDTSQVDGARRQ